MKKKTFILATLISTLILSTSVFADVQPIGSHGKFQFSKNNDGNYEIVIDAKDIKNYELSIPSTGPNAGKLVLKETYNENGTIKESETAIDMSAYDNSKNTDTDTKYKLEKIADESDPNLIKYKFGQLAADGAGYTTMPAPIEIEFKAKNIVFDDHDLNWEASEKTSTNTISKALNYLRKLIKELKGEVNNIETKVNTIETKGVGYTLDENTVTFYQIDKAK